MSRKAVKKPTEAIPFHHVNRKGDTYYLHQGETKTGKPRYFFAKTVRKGFLTEMPAGFEVSESVNGIVSVRRKRDDAPTVSRDDVEVVRAALRKQARLRDHRVEVVGGAIVVFEPDARRDELRKLEAVLGRLPKSFVDDRMRKTKFSPVMRFVPSGDEYSVERVTYRGEGGWSYPLDAGSLKTLAGKYVKVLGTDDFFDLM